MSNYIFAKLLNNLLHAWASRIQPSTRAVHHPLDHSLAEERLLFTRKLGADEGVHLCRRPGLILQLDEDVRMRKTCDQS